MTTATVLRFQWMGAKTWFKGLLGLCKIKSFFMDPETKHPWNDQSFLPIIIVNKFTQGKIFVCFQFRFRRVTDFEKNKTAPWCFYWYERLKKHRHFWRKVWCPNFFDRFWSCDASDGMALWLSCFATSLCYLALLIFYIGCYKRLGEPWTIPSVISFNAILVKKLSKNLGHVTQCQWKNANAQKNVCLQNFCQFRAFKNCLTLLLWRNKPKHELILGSLESVCFALEFIPKGKIRAGI